MNKERLERIGKFLNDRMVVHRNVENDTPWTVEEKMIQELYDNYLDLLIECKKQKEVIDKITEIINYYGVDKEHNDDATLRSILKNMLDILKGGSNE